MSFRQVGHRIRAQRQNFGIPQVALAKKVGISPSYLNLIEHNKRRIGGTLLRHLANALELDVQALSGAEEARLASELAEVATDPVFAETPYSNDEAVFLASSAPQFARAILALYRALKSSQEHLGAVGEQLVQAEVSHQILTLITSIRSFSEILQDYGNLDSAQRSEFLSTTVDETKRLTRLATEMFDCLGGARAISPYPSPAVEVADVIEDQNNFFPELDAIASALRTRFNVSNHSLQAALSTYLAQEHGVSIGFKPEGELPPASHRFIEQEGHLQLAETLPAETVRFQIARLTGWLEAKETINGILSTTRFSCTDAEQRCRYALTSYLAGALLFPYEDFLETARRVRYDVEQLQHHFGGSFEQICHRLTTLHKPGAEGVPFHFLRTDIAGNIDKRFSASGLKLPRHSSACTRWVIYEAFLTPGQVRTQVARMEDGSTFLFVAKSVSEGRAGYRTPVSHQSVMIGCDIAYANAVVYADGLDSSLASVATPVGIRCRQCTRIDCGQRSVPAIGTLLDSLGHSPLSTAQPDDPASNSATSL